MARRLLVPMLSCLAAVALAPSASVAAPPDDSERARGEIVVQVFSGSGADRAPVADVAVTITGEDGTATEGTTDDDGTVTIAVAGGGDYEVAVDPGSVPDDLSIVGNSERSVQVLSGERKFTNFRVAPSDGTGAVRSSDSRWIRFGSLSVAGLKLGAIIALASIGLSLIFGVTGLVNFSHGELVTLGAVVAWWFNAAGGGPGWYIGLAAIPAVVAVGASGWAQETALWGPLRRRRAGNITAFVVSIGMSFFLQYLILWIFDGSPKPYHNYAVQRPMELFQPIDVEPKSIWIIAITVIVLVAIGLMILKTRTGTAMRAVADNADLARSSGIDVERVIMITWVVGGALAGLAGVMFGVSENVQWQMGFKLLLAIFAAVVLGGLGTAFGAMLGGFVIGFAIEVSTIVVPSELKFAVALAVLVAMLLVRPQGLLGQRERVG